MKPVIRIASLVVFWMSLTTICLSDVTAPAGTKDVLSHQDLNRTNLYRPRRLYLGDAGTHTMLLAAPASLSADTTQFILPTTNGSSGYTLQTDGSGNASWAVTPIAGGGTGQGTSANARTALGIGAGDSPSFAATLMTGTGGAGYVNFAHQSADAATPGSGSNDVRVIAKTKKLYTVTDNGSGTAVVSELGSGAGGAGELNYISNGSAATDLTGWTVSDAAKLNLIRTTTAGELPRNILTPTGIKLISVASADSTNACVYYDFTIDSNDAATSRVLKTQWEQKPLAAAPAATDLVLSIVSSSDHTTVLATPQTTAIPVSAGQFATTFVSPATTTASLRVCTPNNMVDNAGIVLSNVIVGPGSLVQGAAVGAWQTFTPTLGLTFTGTAGRYRRVGDSMDIRVSGTYSTGNGSISFTMPTGFTIDVTKCPADSAVGTASITDASGSYKSYVGQAFANSTTAVLVRGNDASATAADTWTQAGPLALGAGDILQMQLTVPIEQWSSSVYLSSGADNSVTPLNWTSYTPTVTGTTGGAYTGSLIKWRRVGDSGEVKGRIVWPTIFTGGSTPVISLPFTIDTAKLPITTGNIILGRAAIRSATSSYDGVVMYVDSTTVCIYVVPATAISTTVPATWVNGNYIDFTIDPLPISGATAQDYMGKVLVGHMTAKVGQSGLINNDSSNVSGSAIKGATDGSAASAGYVGEVKEDWLTGAVTLITATTYYTVSTVLLTPGVWLVSAGCRIDASGTTVEALARLDELGVTGIIRGKDAMSISVTSTTGSGSTLFPSHIVTVVSATAIKTILLKLTSDHNGGSGYGGISAVRIR